MANIYLFPIINISLYLFQRKKKGLDSFNIKKQSKGRSSTHGYKIYSTSQQKKQNKYLYIYIYIQLGNACMYA